MAGKSTKLPGLRGVREREGLSLRQLSIRSDVAFNNISRLENMRQGARRETIYRLAEGLRCSVVELTRPPEQSGEWTPAERGVMLPEADTLVARANALPDELLVYLHTHVIEELYRRGLPRYDVASSGGS